MEIGSIDYLDGFQYRDGRLQFFPTSEGYIRATEVNGTTAYSYVYNYTDHLGNIRLSYAKDPENPNVLKILEENHYYPFGLKHTNYNSDLLVHKKYRGTLGIKELGPFEPLVPVLPYNYKYNGKEFQDEMGMNWYDYGARNYDPAIGRWMNIDPLAEKSRRFSPYAYALDNPMYFIDPDGMKAEASQTASIYYDWDEGGYRTQSGKESTFEEAMSDNDCPSCRTKEDWAAYYQQAENTAPMVGEKSAWGLFNKRLTRGEDEEGHTLFYLDGELMDLRRYNNRAQAIGSLLGDAALIETPSKVLKSLINVLTKSSKAKAGFSVNPSKFDYFFGRVVSGPEKNIVRSAQNLKDLTKLGISTEKQLTNIFGQALKNGTVTSTQTTQYGTTVMKSISIGDKGVINIGYFYQGGNMNATPSITTIIPKIYR